MIKPLRHLVLRGAADAERRARHGAAAPRDRHGAGLRAERGAGCSASAICWLREAIDYAQPNVVHHRRLHPMREDRRAGGGVQRLDRQRRRLGLPQHASAGRRRERHAGRAPLSRGRTVQADLSRPAGAGGRLASRMPETPGLGFEPNRDAIREIAKLPLSQGRGKGLASVDGCRVWLVPAPESRFCARSVLRRECRAGCRGLYAKALKFP